MHKKGKKIRFNMGTKRSRFLVDLASVAKSIEQGVEQEVKKEKVVFKNIKFSKRTDSGSIFIIRAAWFLASLLRLPRRLDATSNPLKQLLVRRYFLAVCLRVVTGAIIVYFSLNFVLFGSDEGLIATVMRARQAHYEWQRILMLTESNSTIITTYHDKLMFPERKVIVGLFSDMNMVNEYANLARLLPVYYYNFSLTKEAMAYLNDTRLKSVGLQISKIEKISSDFTLYKLYSLQSTSTLPVKVVVANL